MKNVTKTIKINPVEYKKRIYVKENEACRFFDLSKRLFRYAMLSCLKKSKGNDILVASRNVIYIEKDFLNKILAFIRDTNNIKQEAVKEFNDIIELNDFDALPKMAKTLRCKVHHINNKSYVDFTTLAQIFRLPVNSLSMKFAKSYKSCFKENLEYIQTDKYEHIKKTYASGSVLLGIAMFMIEEGYKLERVTNSLINGSKLFNSNGMSKDDIFDMLRLYQKDIRSNGRLSVEDKIILKDLQKNFIKTYYADNKSEFSILNVA